MASPAKKTLEVTPAPAAPAKLTVVKSGGVNTAALAPSRRSTRPALKLAMVEGGNIKAMELTRWAQSALETSRSNTFLCDLDFTIVYANQKAIDILKFMEPNLHKHDKSWEFFSASDIVGMNLDFLFTDEPIEFRRASDPRNLPYQKQISTGPCVCDVQVSGIRNDKGELVGYAVDWERITDKLIQERRIQQLMNTLEYSTANTLLCDLSWHVLYANKKAYDIMEFMEPNLHKWSDKWKTFRSKEVVGKSLDWMFTDEPEHFRKASDPRNHPYHCIISTGPCTCEVTVSSTKDAKGEVTGYAVYWERITEKVAQDKQIQEELEEKKYLAAKIEEIMAVTLAIAAGDLTQQLHVEKDDAIGKLAGAFNSMTASLTRMAEAADQIADGNLTVSIEPQSPKDMLANAFSKMVANLSDLVSQALTAADSIAQSSTEVATGTDDLSQRTEEQASSLEETAASMEEMTATVKQNADNARQANLLASTARDMAEKGGVVVNTAVVSMEEINKASKRIADIISVIDEIAFQTNLLALNAAVEAARVGEQGRGFAVVAAEVRNLAGRSATAAKEIKALVQDSVQKVQEGSTLVNQSGATLEEIVTSVKKVADIIAEISAASQEQAVGIDQVNKAIMQMDQITQQNAALVEETAAASQAMTEQAATLQNVVGQFQLGAEYSQATVAPVAMPSKSKTVVPLRGKGSVAPSPSRPSPVRPLVTRRPTAPVSKMDMDDFEEF